MLQTVDADVDATMITAVSLTGITTPVCGSSCFCSAVADAVTLAEDVVTDVEMTAVCGSSCFCSAVVDSAADFFHF